MTLNFGLDKNNESIIFFKYMKRSKTSKLNLNLFKLRKTEINKHINGNVFVHMLIRWAGLIRCINGLIWVFWCYHKLKLCELLRSRRQKYSRLKAEAVLSAVWDTGCGGGGAVTADLVRRCRGSGSNWFQTKRIFRPTVARWRREEEELWR